MKKIFSIAALLCAAISLHAEDVICITPANIAGGAGKSIPANVMLYQDVYSGKITQVQFEVYTTPEISVTSATLFTNPGSIVPSHEEEDWDSWDGESEEPPTKVVIPATMSGKQLTGYYSCVISNTTTDAYAAKNGQIARLVLKASATADPGIYPVYFKNVKIAGADAVTHKLEDVVSYVKVGAAGNVTLALEGSVPSFVNEALANESAISTLDLTEVTASYGDFTYVDGREVVAPATSIESDLQFVRNTTDYYSINLPFASTSVEGNVYGCDWEASFADDNNYFFNEATSTDKDETYLAKGEVTIKGHGAIEGVSKKTNQVGIYVYGNTMYYGNDLTVKPTRGLFWDMALPDPSNRRIVINGTLTNINAAAIDAQSDNTYDLQGRQVQNAKNGVFVVNGKKQFVK